MTHAPRWAWTSVCTRGSDASGPGRSGAPGRAEPLPCCAPQPAPSIKDRGLKNRGHTATGWRVRGPTHMCIARVLGTRTPEVPASRQRGQRPG